VTPEQAILERILALSAVTALVSDRVFMLKLRQGETLPAVRVQLIDEGESQHLRGGAGIFQSRIQVDVYAAEDTGGDPYASASEIALAIQGDDAGSGLSGWRGFSGSAGSTGLHRGLETRSLTRSDTQWPIGQTLFTPPRMRSTGTAHSS